MIFPIHTLCLSKSRPHVNLSERARFPALSRIVMQIRRFDFATIPVFIIGHGKRCAFFESHRVRLNHRENCLDAPLRHHAICRKLRPRSDGVGKQSRHGLDPALLHISDDKGFTSRIHAATLASLRAASFLPTIWTPSPDVERARRLVVCRMQVVRHRTRIKNEVQAILHAHLIPWCPHSDLFGGRGRAWLAKQPVPGD
jgi:hypothetical protein